MRQAELANLISADSALGFVNFGQRQLSANSKRARKMSAFMPMRGRKDGRDDLQQQQFVEEQRALQQLLANQRVSNGDASIMRLVSAAQLASGNDQALDAEQLSWARPLPTPAPRQFLARHLKQHFQQQQQQPAAAEAEAGEGGESLFGLGAPAQPARMQAKLRRAFHPMRGKKADSANLALLAAELAERADGPDGFESD